MAARYAAITAEMCHGCVLTAEACGRLAALDGEIVLPHGAGMNGFLAICTICREIMS